MRLAARSLPPWAITKLLRTNLYALLRYLLWSSLSYTGCAY
jgi:hypothetical protein